MRGRGRAPPSDTQHRGRSSVRHQLRPRGRARSRRGRQRRRGGAGTRTGPTAALVRSLTDSISPLVADVSPVVVRHVIKLAFVCVVGLREDTGTRTPHGPRSGDDARAAGTSRRAADGATTGRYAERSAPDGARCTRRVVHWRTSVGASCTASGGKKGNGKNKNKNQQNKTNIIQKCKHNAVISRKTGDGRTRELFSSAAAPKCPWLLIGGYGD